MKEIVDEIREHKNTILGNNEIIIELLTEIVEPDTFINNSVLSSLREQNRSLKIIINDLKEKLGG